MAGPDHNTKQSIRLQQSAFATGFTSWDNLSTIEFEI